MRVPIGTPLYPRGFVTLGTRHSCLLRAWRVLCTAVVAGVGVVCLRLSCPRVTNSRVACGVPIGTLTWSGLIRGSQGPSVTLVEWLRHSCLLRAGCPLHCGRGWRGCGVSPLVVSEGYKPSGGVWSTYRHSHVEWPNPRVAGTLGYSCGVASPLLPCGRGVSLRSAGVCAGDRAAKPLHRSNRGFVTPGLGKQA